MPMNRELYPDNWDEIALQVKEEAGWKCEECGRQCYRPGEKCPDKRNVLTVSHQNHDPADCRRENLKALCSGCHLRYDAKHHAETRRKNREKEKTMELNITQEQIDDLVKQVITERIAGIFDGEHRASFYETVKKEVEKQIRENVAKGLKGKIEGIVDEVIADFLAQPVDIYDGWGYGRQRFESYSDFFAAKLSDQLRNSYKVKDEFSKQLRAKVDACWEEYENEAIALVLANHAKEAK